jgi:hypothetical protein
MKYVAKELKIVSYFLLGLICVIPAIFGIVMYELTMFGELVVTELSRFIDRD